MTVNNFLFYLLAGLLTFDTIVDWDEGQYVVVSIFVYLLVILLLRVMFPPARPESGEQ